MSSPVKIEARCEYSKLVPIGDLKPNPRNPNKHPAGQIELLAKAIRHQGWRAPVVVSKRSGLVVVGHGRLEAALVLGCKTVPVDYQEFASEADEWAHMLADNRLAELSEEDLPGLKDLIEELDTGALDMDLTGFDEAARQELMLAVPPEGEADAEPQMDRAAELNEQWQVKAGDLWRIGEHRLLCGDATKADDVALVLGGAIPFLCVTDPPYGVNYDPSWRSDAAEAGVLAYAARRIGEVVNDDRSDWSEAWALFPGDVIYSWHPAGATSLVHANAIQGSGFVIRIQIIWAKSNFPISRGDYHVRHEPCWYAVRKGRVAKRTNDRTQTTLWEINLDKNVAGGHSTQKPLECMARPMRNHEPCDVYDPFLGSGTTMVAAQNLGRRCFGMEISGNYCAVILQRMSDAFPGIKIERVNG